MLNNKYLNLKVEVLACLHSLDFRKYLSFRKVIRIKELPELQITIDI